MKNTSGFLLRLLVDPRYRICRHFLLFVLSVIILSVNFYVDVIEDSRFLVSNVIQSALLLVPIYLSVFVLTPRLLLKNKVGTYVISVVLVILLALLFSYILRKEAIEEEYELFQFWLAAFFFISSIIQLCLIIAGASAVIVFQDYVKYGQRIDELKNATMQSELEQLKNQINPHFLFNMLNNVYVLIRKGRDEAAEVLFKLEDLLRYQFNDSTQDRIQLSSDIRFMNDFLNLEKIRRDNFNYTISKEGDINSVWLPPLLFIPFVENAVKHNTDGENASFVYISFNVQDNRLFFRCENSKPAEEEEKNNRIGGLGLKNIRRRLELLYPGRHSLEIIEDKQSYIVNLYLDL